MRLIYVAEAQGNSTTPYRLVLGTADLTMVGNAPDLFPQVRPR